MTHSGPAAHTRSSRHSASVGELMTPMPFTIASDEKLSAAHRLMNDNALRHLPVLRNQKLVGVLSQRDLFFLESIAGVDIDIDVVADAMTPEVFTTTPDAQIGVVATAMARNRYGCAVVMDRGDVVGVFTVTDAVRYLATILGSPRSD